MSVFFPYTADDAPAVVPEGMADVNPVADGAVLVHVQALYEELLADVPGIHLHKQPIKEKLGMRNVRSMIRIIGFVPLRLTQR